jgi:Predicted nucleotide-binding protein containing TIR-like domain
MKKIKSFRNTIFAPKIIGKAIAMFIRAANIDPLNPHFTTLYIDQGVDSSHHDSLEEFLADYSKGFNYYDIRISNNGYSLRIWFTRDYYECITDVYVGAPTRAEIFKLLNFYVDNAAKYYVTPRPRPQQTEDKELPKDASLPIIFIGHGADVQWRDLKDYLKDMLQMEVVAYEAAPRANHSIKDILAEMAAAPTFAILVFTGENEYKDGTLHARENVVHELGFFQGNLSFNRTMVLLEEGTDYFSNIDGIQQVRFTKGNVKAAFGEVLATLKREFGKI